MVAAVGRRPAVLRRHAADLGHAVPDADRARRRGPARALRRDLPLRVRARPACARSSSRSLELLAGVPTIVFGYFALTFFTPTCCRTSRHRCRRSSTRLSAGIILGILVLPTIASVAEDALSAVPASLREGAFGLGAEQAGRSRCGSSSRPRCRASSRRSCSAPRAPIGETVIILSPAARSRTSTLDPRQPRTRRWRRSSRPRRAGDIPTGSIEYKTIFAVGIDAVRHDLALNAVAIRSSASTARCTNDRRPDRRRPRRAQASSRAASGEAAATDLRLPARSCSCLFDRRCLVPRRDPRRCRASTASRRSLRLHHELPVAHDPRAGRHPVGARRDALPDGDLRGLRRAARRRHRGLPRGVRRPQTAGGTASIEVNIQNLAAVPSVVYGILGLAFIVRGPLDLGPGAPGGRRSRSACSCCRS